MDPCDRLLVECTRLQFGSESRAAVRAICARHSIPWQVVLETSLAHGVAPLVFRNLTSLENERGGESCLQIPEEVLAAFQSYSNTNRLVKTLGAQRIQEIAGDAASRGIEIMLIKGAALDLALDRDPALTMSDDIDLMANGADSMAKPLEWRSHISMYRKGSNHSDPFNQWIRVEIEWFGHHDVSINGILPVDFQDVWTSSRQVTLADTKVRAMCPEHLLLTACIASCRRRYFRLKNLSDIAETLRTCQIDWDRFTTSAHQWQCNIIAFTAFRAVELTVGCSVPDHVLKRLKVNPVRRALIQFLAKRRSFSTFATQIRGIRFLGQNVNLSLLLPYSTYPAKQLIGHLLVAWRRRRRSTRNNARYDLQVSQPSNR